LNLLGKIQPIIRTSCDPTKVYTEEHLGRSILKLNSSALSGIQNALNSNSIAKKMRCKLVQKVLKGQLMESRVALPKATSMNRCPWN
jgi:hypothetical protein